MATRTASRVFFVATTTAEAAMRPATSSRIRPADTVAAEAGVSRATVSRVVNGSTSVAASIREAVNRAVEELAALRR